ncbi:hypothetical protein Mal15_38100 [Stieleria maiorica]|uniref:Uncharacterized protein n=1 Tax=Stieleria maiorica TaxID=2795974 RepID=A0A5B9MJC6_9BACT|nr:hypothetical protein [Stieleria maiorica]QEF99744.1 hypothetical protein Mal15_38100 [Stieleria maiorica]
MDDDKTRAELLEQNADLYGRIIEGHIQQRKDAMQYPMSPERVRFIIKTGEVIETLRVLQRDMRALAALWSTIEDQDDTVAV